MNMMMMIISRIYFKPFFLKKKTWKLEFEQEKETTANELNQKELETINKLKQKEVMLHLQLEKWKIETGAFTSGQTIDNSSLTNSQPSLKKLMLEFDPHQIINTKFILSII